MSLLTDQSQVSGVSLNDFIHVVVTGDTTQNPAGSSFKASIQQVIRTQTNSFGLFSQTGNSVVISATTTPSTLFNGGVGTLTVPANGFSIGDSFSANLGGLFSVKNNDTVRIILQSDSGVLADSGIQTMPASSNDIWELDVFFSIRNIGVAGVASIVTLGKFSTTRSTTGSPSGFGFTTVNNTTFDTTMTNTLNITLAFGTNNAQNSIFTDFFVLQKVY